MAKNSEPKKLPKDNDKLIELIKRYMGMTNALMEEVMNMKYGQKLGNINPRGARISSRRTQQQRG